jgi:hypothetical protein
MCGEEKILHELLCDRGGTALDSARLATLMRDLLRLLLIDPVVQQEVGPTAGVRDRLGEPGASAAE